MIAGGDAYGNSILDAAEDQIFADNSSILATLANLTTLAVRCVYALLVTCMLLTTHCTALHCTALRPPACDDMLHNATGQLVLMGRPMRIVYITWLSCTVGDIVSWTVQ